MKTKLVCIAVLFAGLVGTAAAQFSVEDAQLTGGSEVMSGTSFEAEGSVGTPLGGVLQEAPTFSALTDTATAEVCVEAACSVSNWSIF